MSYGLSEPECWSWPVPTNPAESGFALLAAWHEGRCAICGVAAVHQVLDHEHDSGLVRGWLCRSCNVREGLSHDDVFDRYRVRPPAQTLGVRIFYFGRNWPLGWWQDVRQARRLTGNVDWHPKIDFDRDGSRAALAEQRRQEAVLRVGEVGQL